MTIPLWYSVAADAASLLSLVITAIIWYQTRLIKQAVVARARLPQLVRRLDKQAAALLSSLEDWPTAEDAANARISECYSILQNLLPKLSRTEREQPKRVMNLIRSRNALWRGWGKGSDTERRSKMSEVQWGLLGVSESLKQIHEDQNQRV